MVKWLLLLDERSRKARYELATKIDNKYHLEIDDKDLARVLPKPKIDGLIRKPASSKQILNTISNLITDL
jgi:hypothetical protein